jgi:anaerobic ribonucleoside-triphosphate reductase activating protein
MNISVNKAHFPVTVLGPGRRIGIWLQGCSIHCKGCISKDTWERDPGRDLPLARLMDWCRDTTGGRFDGVTLSGGEPFDQPKALSALLDALILWRATDALDFDILCYSGYPLTVLKSRHDRLLGKLDAIIPEPYVQALPLTHLWRGSANQQLVPLSERGRKRYGAHVDAPADSLGKRIQMAVDGNRVWYIGVPGRGDMAALEKSCSERGVKFGDVSWRQ